MWHCFQDTYIFAFYAEFKDSHQKWRENDLSKTVPDESVYTLGVKNFVGITLFHTSSKIHMLLHFTQNFKMTSEDSGKTIFGKQL